MFFDRNAQRYYLNWTIKHDFHISSGNGWYSCPHNTKLHPQALSSIFTVFGKYKLLYAFSKSSNKQIQPHSIFYCTITLNFSISSDKDTVDLRNTITTSSVIFKHFYWSIWEILAHKCALKKSLSSDSNLKCVSRCTPIFKYCITFLFYASTSSLSSILINFFSSQCQKIN